MLNIDYLNLKASRKRISCFILKSVNLDTITVKIRKNLSYSTKDDKEKIRLSSVEPKIYAA